MNYECPKISDLINDDIVADAYELILSDHVTFIDPSSYKIATDLVIKPNDYFITSGDAVQKTKIMVKNYTTLLQKLKLVVDEQQTDNYTEYYNELCKQAENAKQLYELLVKARGPNIFLETEWNLHRLYILPKNPRIKQA